MVGDVQKWGGAAARAGTTGKDGPPGNITPAVMLGELAFHL
jgi:hypothetical protein